MTVDVTTLANGLRVVTDAMPRLQSASVGVWVDAGARYETPEVNGVAHLLEHMAFKGTKRRNAQTIAEEIEAVGGHLNAYTSREQTAYFARVLRDDVPLAVDILADILQHSVFDAAELERERTVVVQEIGQTEDTPDDIIFDQLQATAYPDQPLGWSILGTVERVENMAREALAGFMRRHYLGPRMVLVAAGAVEHAAIVALAEDAFGDLSSADAPEFAPASYAGGDYRDHRDLEQVHFAMGLPGLRYHDDDFYASQVMSTVLGGGMSSRLFQEIRENRGLVYSIYSFVSAYMDGGLFGIYAGTGAKEVEELIPVVCDELVKLSHDITDEEAARARSQLKASILMSRESSGSRAEQLAQQLIAYGRPLPVAEIGEKIEAVDVAALQSLAKRLAASRPTLAALGPVGRVEALDRVAARLN